MTALRRLGVSLRRSLMIFYRDSSDLKILRLEDVKVGVRSVGWRNTLDEGRYDPKSRLGIFLNFKLTQNFYCKLVLAPRARSYSRSIA